MVVSTQFLLDCFLIPKENTFETRKMFFISLLKLFVCSLENHILKFLIFKFHDTEMLQQKTWNTFYSITWEVNIVCQWDFPILCEKLKQYLDKTLHFFYIIRIHSIQAWTGTTRHGITIKRSTKRLEHTVISLERTYR